MGVLVNRTVYLAGEPYKIVISVDRNQDPEEKIEGVTMLGAVYTIKNINTGELLKVYPWDVWDPDGLDSQEGG